MKYEMTIGDHKTITVEMPPINPIELDQHFDIDVFCAALCDKNDFVVEEIYSASPIRDEIEGFEDCGNRELVYDVPATFHRRGDSPAYDYEGFVDVVINYYSPVAE